MGDFVTPLQDILTHYSTSRADKVYAKDFGKYFSARTLFLRLFNLSHYFLLDNCHNYILYAKNIPRALLFPLTIQETLHTLFAHSVLQLNYVKGCTVKWEKLRENWIAFYLRCVSSKSYMILRKQCRSWSLSGMSCMLDELSEMR